MLQTLLQNGLNTDVAHFSTHIKSVWQQIRLFTGLNEGGKTRNIAFFVKQFARFFCPFYRTLRKIPSHWFGRSDMRFSLSEGSQWFSWIVWWSPSQNQERGSARAEWIVSSKGREWSGGARWTGRWASLMNHIPRPSECFIVSVPARYGILEKPLNFNTYSRARRKAPKIFHFWVTLSLFIKGAQSFRRNVGLFSCEWKLTFVRKVEDQGSLPS